MTVIKLHVVSSAVKSAVYKTVTDRGGTRSTRGLGLTLTVRGQSISISIGMLGKLIRMTLGLKHRAWSGRPTCHPQTPVVTNINS
jgi:hypothetical protein